MAAFAACAAAPAWQIWSAAATLPTWSQIAQTVSVTAKAAMKRKAPQVMAHSWKVKE